MSDFPTTPVFVGIFALVALRPPMPRRSMPFNLQFALGWLINEQPFLGLWWLLAGTLAMLVRPDLDSPVWWLVAGATALDVSFLAMIAGRARSARRVLSTAHEAAFGAGPGNRRTRPSWWRIVLLPIVSWRPDVRRIRNRRYGPARRGNRLDIYVSRRRRGVAAPMLVYVHGGASGLGSKLLGSRPLLYRLVARGWTCVSVDYRVVGANVDDQVADVRAAIAWTRAHAREYGGTPADVFMAGGSWGAQLATIAALQDAHVSGVITLYGYYGAADRIDAHLASHSVGKPPVVPPFLIVHGALDTLVLAQDAREFAGRLRAASGQPVVYAELPGTQHNFDFFHSRRAHAVGDAVERFATAVVAATRENPASYRGDRSWA